MNNREWIWSLETGSQTDRNRHSRLRFSLFVVYDGTGDEQVVVIDHQDGAALAPRTW